MVENLIEPYRGLRVLDVSQGFAGPYCGGILARNGADVIKVEPPHGDWARTIGGALDGHTAFSLVPNVRKRAICVDTAKAEGRDVLARLARDVDVVIQNFRPGVVERMGIADAQLRPSNAGLIYLSVLGFGPGPYADRPATDTVVQGFTGMMVMNKDAQGMPRRIGMLAVDTAAGIYGAQQVGAALYARLAGHGGRHIKLSLMEVAASFQAMPIMDAAMHRDRPSPPLSVPIGTFRTQDGHINLSCVSTPMFHGICRALGFEEWIADLRFADGPGRLNHADEITRAISRRLTTQTSAHWLEALEKHDVLCGPVNDYATFLDDPHVSQSGLAMMLEGGAFDGLPLMSLPGLSGSETIAQAAPPLGAHTRQVLTEQGFEPGEIDRLIETRAIIQQKTGEERA